ncbi:hypothetical protein BH09VER1_BH09VER1_36380 [soil metagenome]
MKAAALRRFRQKLASRQSVYGLWITLESPSITEIAVALGLDWITIDAEHGHLDWGDIASHLRAAVRSETVALVRISQLDAGLIKRALDLGADGVVVPNISTVEQLTDAVSFSHYPPRGVRGVGAERATCWGECFADHAKEAEANVLIVPLIESVSAGENIDALLQVDGTELFFFGPADYSASAGFLGQWEGPGVADRILATKDRLRSAGKCVGIITRNDQDLKLRTDQGFQALGLGLDAGLLIRSLKNSLKSLGRPSQMQTSLIPQDYVAASRQSPLTILPEEFRPTRREVMNPLGTGKPVTLEAGVNFECLIGAHNEAQNLTTGIVTFAPGAKLPYHVHTFGESVTVLEGTLHMEVQGRNYQLGAMDNITIPRGLPHGAVNLSDHPVRAHVAMATANPSRDLVDEPSSRQEMPEATSGCPGGEHVVRFKTARRYEAGPNTQFIDYLNSNLIPGIEMSGGYGLFFKGGRLPAHIHDFDESICIVEGSASCNVEGRVYTMADFSTALQPRGRVHYFINDQDKPMAMLWVYAGPMPERIIIDESFTRPEGAAWK